MTDAQHARLPGILRDIVDCDRRIAALRRGLAGLSVVPFYQAKPLAGLRRMRREMSGQAAGLYGRAPLRGDTGPGRPTAAAA